MASTLCRLIVVLIATTSAACSGGSGSMTGPSGAGGGGSGEGNGLAAGIIEVEGDVSNLSGTCPSLTFRLAGRAVRTSSSTIFEHITCSAIRNASHLEVLGRPQADGSLTATGVEGPY